MGAPHGDAPPERKGLSERFDRHRTDREQFGRRESRPYIFGMRKGERKWQVIRMRSRGEYLGTVTAADEKTALKVAIKALKLSVEDQKRWWRREVGRN
jgi:hypothetical protein